MPIYEYECGCKYSIERYGQIGEDHPVCPRCGLVMAKKLSRIAMVKIDGKGYPSRRKWCQNWTPDSPKFSTGSLHGQKY
jgi:putative FmdB family regulatory protein